MVNGERRKYSSWRGKVHRERGIERSHKFKESRLFVLEIKKELRF